MNNWRVYGSDTLAAVLGWRDASWFRKSVTAGPTEVVIAIKNGEIADIFSGEKRSTLSKWETFRNLIGQGPKLQLIKTDTSRFNLTFWLEDSEEKTAESGMSFGIPALTKDGQIVSARIDLSFSIEAEKIDNFLRLLRGRSALNTTDVATEIRHELSSKVFHLELSQYLYEDIRGNRDLLVNLTKALQRELGTTLLNYGLKLENVSINWGLTLDEQEVLANQRHDAEIAATKRTEELRKLLRKDGNVSGIEADRVRNNFISNSTEGFTSLGRWISGLIVISIFWILGGIPAYLTCGWDNLGSVTNLSCGGTGVAEGYSSVVAFGLGMFSFIFGIIGVWVALKLIHHKSLTKVVTGRVSYDFNRTLYGVFIGLGYLIVLIAVERFIVGSDFSFDSPEPKQYLAFLILAVVLATYLAGFIEIIFRGYLIQALSGISSNRVFLVLSSAVIFVCSYFVLTSVLNIPLYEYNLYSIFMLGLFLALIVVVDGGIELSVGYLTIKILWGLIIQGSTSSLIPTPTLLQSSQTSDDFLPLLIGQFILLISAFVFLGIKYGWFNLGAEKKELTYGANEEVIET